MPMRACGTLDRGLAADQDGLGDALFLCPVQGAQNAVLSGADGDHGLGAAGLRGCQHVLKVGDGHLGPYAFPVGSLLAAWSAAMGTVKLKWLPAPGSLWTVTVPPCASTVSLTMANPSPVPPKRRVLEPSTW